MDNEIHGAIDTVPQWSPGLMAGGSERVVHRWEAAVPAAMEPRPDGRGKSTSAASRPSVTTSRNGAPA